MTALDDRPATTGWRTRVACRHLDLPIAAFDEMFFPTHTRSAANPAKRVCRTCPVALECLDDALDAGPSLNGVFGGTDQTERRDILERRAKSGAYLRAEAVAMYHRLRPGAPSDHAAKAVGAALGVAQRTVGKWVVAEAVQGPAAPPTDTGTADAA